MYLIEQRANASLAKEVDTNSAGEEEQPNASKASTYASRAERQTSSSCDERADVVKWIQSQARAVHEAARRSILHK